MNKINVIKKSWKIFNWKLFIAIFFTLFIPIIYRTSRIFFIGTLPNSWNFSVAANLQWINIMFEVLEEAFLLPLFFTLKKILSHKKLKTRNRQITWQIMIISFIWIFFIIIFVIIAKQLLEFMSVQNISNETIKFVRIEIMSRFFVMISKIGVIFLIAKNLWKQLIITLIFSTIINVLLDLFISSNNNFSLKKGVVGIAYTQLITSSIMGLIYIILIYKKYNFKLNHLKPKIFIDKTIWKQCFYSGIESFVRNAFFIWFVIKTINRLGSGYNQGDFWVMNSFIWNWLLLTILTLSQFMNRDQALNDNKTPLKERLIVPSIIILITIIIWLVTIPAYEPFIRIIMNNDNSKLISRLAIISIGFYIMFAINEPIDKILYGDGKAQYVLIQSLITNVIVYIPYYYLKTSMTIEDVAIMMGLAITIDSLITFVMFFVLYKKKKLVKIQ